MLRARCLFFIACALLLQGSARICGAASDGEFDVKVWETDEGLPHNTVLSLVQARDGHLWVGTYNGLVRFDGINFTNLTPRLSDRIFHLFEDSGRTLWIGTASNGTVMLKDGRVTAPKELAFNGLERRLRSACEDAQGNVWLYYEHGDLWRYAQGRFSKFTLPQQESVGNRSMIRETNGTVWVGTSNQHRVALAAGNTGGELAVAESIRIGGNGLDALLASKSGGYWRLANAQVQRIREGVPHNVVNYQWPRVATAFCEDNNGNLVLASFEAGIFVVQTNGMVSRLSITAPPVIHALLTDREGSLWVGAEGGGLNRVTLKRRGFQTFERTRNWVVQSVAEDAEGNLWIGGSQGFGLGHWNRNNDVFRAMDVSSSPEPIQCVFADREQRVWVSSARSASLYQFTNGVLGGFDSGGAIQHIVQAIHQDRAGRLWFGTAGELVRLENNIWKRFAADDGLSSTNVTAIADGVNGDVWIGTGGGGINQFREGKFTALREADGVPSDTIAGLIVDADGVLWITTSRGLGRWQEGKWSRYTTREGLMSDVLGSVTDDGQGNLWVASSAGLLHLPKKALNELAGGVTRTIPCRAYGKGDGLPTTRCTFGSQPGSWMGRGNTLWFPTSKGLASLNVSRFRPNTNPPPVAVESVVVDDSPRALSGDSAGLVLQPGEERIEIQYASLSLSAAERARFRYWLEGFEKDWIEADTTRVARYNKLPPGQYTFHVTASNEDGVWNETGASLSLTVLPEPPPFWRTWWFLTFGPLVIIALTIGIVHYVSTQKLQRQLATMRQQEALQKERARIARDIHDQVGASLTQMALLGELVETDKDSPEEVQSHAQQISQTARETTRALDEIVWTVNPQNDTLEGLVNYICKNAQDYLAVADVRYRFDVPPQVPPLPLPPDVRHNVFLASKEAVTNVVKHAKANSAWLRMKLEDGTFTVEIEDNGRGVAGLDLNAPRTRNGLKNMRKRMEDVGGTFHLGPGKEGGALVRLTVPLAKIGGGS